jgi:hypothetical protein
MVKIQRKINDSRLCPILLGVVFLFACLPLATPFQTTLVRPTTLVHPPTTQAPPTRYPTHLNASSSDDGNDSKKMKTFTVYKDDCFGFTTFLAGIGSRDAVFVGIFVVLSLTADFGTRLGWLPADTKRPYIVDRKVPGAVAAITLSLTPLITPLVAAMGAVEIPEPAPAARTVQLAVCSFSMITAFLDIRWRDRFDYPKEFYQKKD